MVGVGPFNQPVSFIYCDNDVVFRITYYISFIIFTVLIKEFAVAVQVAAGRVCVLFTNVGLKVVF
jgi:hypothetical protein